MSKKINEQLFKALKDLDVISQSQLERAYQDCSDTISLGSVLLDRDLISDENLGKVLADIYGISYVDFNTTPVDFNVFSFIPENIAKKHEIVAFKVEGNFVYLATHHPDDVYIIEALEKKTGLKSKVYFATTRTIADVLTKYSKDFASTFNTLIQQYMESKSVTGDTNKVEAPIIRAVDMIFDQGYQEKASDMIEDMSNHVVITITDTKVVAEQIDLVADDPVVLRLAVSWKSGYLSEAIDELLAQIPGTKHIRVLLSESLCHISGFIVPKDKSGNREFIRQKASEVFLEDLGIVRWDYAVLQVADKDAYVQVVCVNERFNKELSQMQEKLLVSIDVILPASYVLLNSFEEKDESFVIVYADDVLKVMSIVKNGLVMFATTFDMKSVAKKFQQTVEYAEKYLAFIPQKIVISGLSKSAVLEEHKDSLVIEAELNTAANLVELKLFNGADKKVLSIALEKNDMSSVEETVIESLSSSTQVEPRTKFGLLLLVVSVLGLVGGFFLIKFLS